jgi:hypothetical protein
VVTSLVLAVGMTGCEDDNTGLGFVQPPVDAGCVVSTPRTFEVYFVVDVSASINDFLDDIQEQLTLFAQSFPELDENEDRVFVDYYVIGFVNDVAFFPPGSTRMTSPIAVAEALRQAVEAGADNTNVLNESDNGERNENLLDALGAVLDNQPAADRTLVILATDENFSDQGEILSPNIEVQNSFSDIRTAYDLARPDILLYAFTPGNIEGIDRNFRGMPPLVLEDAFDLDLLADDTNAVGNILARVAVDAACRTDDSDAGVP